MNAPPVFRNLEWQVARTRRAIEQYDQREEDTDGKGAALLEHSVEDLDKAVDEYQEARRHGEV